ncbi:aminoglycoside phosphotransferase family protein [Chryseolinea sp. H1M3-3]|uniref:phosphotransferase enzyme family protein n=1 Tax=Chryseolinea sp. H1M3-3 TaxID=3034144 RepID=UPI0023EB85A4|nr:aminoglycoside phosphotransferase family protein [Chryseolinea sp. H1M3-3]
MIKSILETFNIRGESMVEPLTSGLINRTWKVTDGDKQFILQQINDHVFKRPTELAANIRMLHQYLKAQSPDYLFVSPISNSNNDDLIYVKDVGYFRLFPFIKGSHTIEVVSSAEQAFEASYQFGKFTRLLAGFDVSKLHITIPDFHNLTLRYQQFEAALQNGSPQRIKQSGELIRTIKKHTNIVEQYEQIRKKADVKQRVMHHDTKISNVLFDAYGKGMCVIDLDTIMPGYFISDVGDMMRTYLSPANEEVKNFEFIEVRDDVFSAIVTGYVSAMGKELTAAERNLFFYSGLFLIYMQAIRFLTDHLNNDIYYGARYEDHNFVRAGNQLALLKKMEEKQDTLQTIISKL